MAKTLRSALPLLCTLAPLLFLQSGCGGSSETSTIFELVIENIAPQNALVDETGFPIPVLYSGGAGAVHSLSSPIYTEGQPASPALEKFAEDGDPTDLVTDLQSREDVTLVVLSQTPQQMDASGGFIGPGQSFRVLFNAESAISRLSFALPALQTNDIIAATVEAGIPLFNADGTPVSGDITNQFILLDVGTEVNETPGSGPNQPPRQLMENTGGTEGGVVRPTDGGTSIPSIAGTLRITLTQIDSID